MAEFKIGRLRFAWEGEWFPATTYNRDAIIQYNGKMYACLTPHTSSIDFYNELYAVRPGDGAPTPYWQLVMPGKTWKGEWRPDVKYSLDNIIVYGGVVYLCNEDHTSDTFILDQGYWDTFLETGNWNTDWAPITAYGVRDIVKYGGIVYSCTENHLSSDNIIDGLELDSDKWEIFNSGIEYKGTWHKPTTVTGSVSGTTLTTTAGTPVIGQLLTGGTIADNTIIIAGEGNTWTLSTANGSISSATYTANIRYRKNDIVKFGADLWIANDGHPATSTFNSGSTWDLWLPGLEYANTWSSATTYQPGDTVVYGGYTYTSNTVNNIANVPSEDGSTDWTVLTLGYVIRGEWDRTGQYKVGDVVRRNGGLYEALADHNVQDPAAYSITSNYNATGSSGTTLKVVSNAGLTPGMIISGTGFTQGQSVVRTSGGTTVIISAPPDGTPVDFQPLRFTGVNYVYWKFLVPGSFWAGRWTLSGSDDNSYSVGDIVTWQNSTYVCIQSHGTTSLRRPDLDVNKEFWIYYILHARKNALTTPGDLEYYNNESYDRVAIGTEDYALRSTSGAPAWSYLHKIPRVYYVATTGTDRSDSGWGETWDKPWKTIAYACNYVKNGTENPYAKQTLINNKAWLVEEMYQWMLYQMNHPVGVGTTPFSPTSVFDEDKTRRDAEFIIDALVYDLSRGGNSQIVAATLAYFSFENGSMYINSGTTAAMPYIIASLTYLTSLINSALNNTAPTANYQALNGVSVGSRIMQSTTANSSESGTVAFVANMLNTLITALTNESTADVPPPNSGITVTINVKTGTYSETLPITVPENTALNGDELRGVLVQPLLIVDTVVTKTTDSKSFTYNNGTSNVTISASVITVESTEGLVANTPVQFTQDIGATITAGVTYYAVAHTITDTEFAVSSAPNGTAIVLETNPSISSTSVYGGDATKDMFYCRNGSGIRNMTLRGLLGILGPLDDYEIRRPTGGVFVSLDPGTGTTDTTAWIFRRSPYIQNVTAFGNGATALKIDGTLHDGGNKSIVCNDFTHIVSDGIGIWCTGPGALCEAVSVFSYFGYTGYFAEAGGRIRATNGNSSYGTYGVIAEGYDPTETPATGKVDNQSAQVQATVQSAFGANAELLRLNYTNAGSAYYSTTTNLIKYSNEFETSPWVSDGNLRFSKITQAPSGLSEAWTLIALSDSADTGYIYQNITVNPTGLIYTGLTAVNITGSGGTGLNPPATFDVTVTSTEYLVTVNFGGAGYVGDAQMSISGAQLGGMSPDNDCILTVTRLSGSAILEVSVEGTVPEGSAQNYTCSVYVKQGSAPNIDLYGIFSGSSSKTSYISYNFATGTVTPGNSSGGFLPVNYGAESSIIDDGWFRLWFALNDVTGLNSQLQFRIYAKGASSGSISKVSYIYGAQAEISDSDYSPSFYLETTSQQFTSHANFNIVGSGTDVVTIGDEIRSNSVFQSRVSDSGAGYLTASNNAQSGNKHYIQIAQSDNNTNSNYVGMRMFVVSGTGAGQYGYISYYDNGPDKKIWVLKESFTPLEISATSPASPPGSTNKIQLSYGTTTDTLYVDQPVQFIPTYYTTAVSGTSLAQVTVTAAVGGTTNTLTVSSTVGMIVNMAVVFTTSTFSTVSQGYTYYIHAIDSVANTIQITEQLYGNVWPLTTATGIMSMAFTSNTSYLNGSTTNMVVNYPIQFTGTALGGVSVGTTYYINDVNSSNTFSISTSLVDITVTATNPSNKGLSATTSSLIPLNPIVFSAPTLGGLIDGQKYYISKIIDGSTFQVSTSLIALTATHTADSGNLITVSDTSLLVVNNPIKFVGTSFGNLEAEKLYYVQVINNSTTFTVSNTPGGGAVNLFDADGSLEVRTAPASSAVTSDSGTMAGTSTSSKRTLTLGIGSMNGTFSTQLFGGVTIGTDYYINTIDSVARQVTVTATQGSGTPVTLSSKTGSMKMAAIGWDHVNPGTPISSALDNTSVYFIEPRTTFTEPNFVQLPATTTIPLAALTTWSSITHGNGYWMALPSGNSTAARSVDGLVWEEVLLPSSQTWTSIAYGNNYWVAISSGGTGNSKAIYSNSNGLGWRTVNLPSATTWNNVVYGNGIFLAVAEGGASAYSTNFGRTWVSIGAIGITNVTGLAYGAGIFVAVSSSGTGAYYTKDAGTWTVSSPLTASDWSSVAFGNNMFVAVATTANKSAYSRDGVDWYESSLTVAADIITYGQGIFVALKANSTTAYTSEAGEHWKKQSVSSKPYAAASFGWSASNKGIFAVLDDNFDGWNILTGVRTKGRVTLSSGVISAIGEFEPGSGYVTGAGVPSAPSVTFTDPNVTSLATVSPRLSDGTLSSPTFVARGTGYSTNSTRVYVTGGGYADTFQSGLTIILKDLTRLPSPGDNLTINGVDQIFKVTSATAIYGTVAPNLQANVQLSPDVTTAQSVENNTNVSIRSKYSQARLTNHDFLNIGYGGVETSNYPGFPDSGYVATQQNQVVEVNYGRVFYTSTDQDGNFKVGNLFGVQQATGIVTLSASQFGLTGLDTLSLGGIAVGGSSTVISQFSTDVSFTANSDTIVPTQKAIKQYLTNRLSQGGSNTFTGQFIAGSILVGGPDKIGSAIANGLPGSVVNMGDFGQVANFTGPGSGVDGDMAAMDFFMRHSTKK